jgi:hypothetical protein
VATKTDFREFARHDRYRAFEIMMWWEGACNASDLSVLFNVRRENVTKDIQAYRAEHGKQVVYDSLDKTYRPAPGFAPVYTAGQIMEYVDFTRRLHQDGSGDHRMPGWLDAGPRPHIEPKPHLFRALVYAIRYRSWNHPQGKDRCIHPHALAYSGLRWHCRAFDASTESYRDFHLGRFERYEETSDVPGISGDRDIAWHTLINIEMVPNPALSEGEQDLVRADYGLVGDALIVGCRQSMAPYVLQSYQVDPDWSTAVNGTPRRQPLVLKNHEQIAVSLFTDREQVRNTNREWEICLTKTKVTDSNFETNFHSTCVSTRTSTVIFYSLENQKLCGIELTTDRPVTCATVSESPNASFDKSGPVNCVMILRNQIQLYAHLVFASLRVVLIRLN